MQTTYIPPRPDYPVLGSPAPKRRVWPWVLAGIAVIAIASGVGNVSENLGREAADSGVISIDEPGSGLVDYNGYTVTESADMMESFWVESMCDLVPLAGYESSRTSFLEAEPQLGTDTFEGALFDELMSRC